MGITFWNGGNYARIEEPNVTVLLPQRPAEVPWERRDCVESKSVLLVKPEWSLEIDEVLEWCSWRIPGHAHFHANIEPVLTRWSHHIRSKER